MSDFSVQDIQILMSLFNDISPELNLEKREEYSNALLRISRYYSIFQENNLPTDDYPSSPTLLAKGTQKAYSAFDKIIEALSNQQIEEEDELNAFRQALHYGAEDSEYVNNIIEQIKSLREDIEATKSFNTPRSRGRQFESLTIFHNSLAYLYREKNNGKVNFYNNPVQEESTKPWLTGRSVEFILHVQYAYSIPTNSHTSAQIINALNRKPKARKRKSSLNK